MKKEKPIRLTKKEKQSIDEAEKISDFSAAVVSEAIYASKRNKK